MTPKWAWRGSRDRILHSKDELLTCQLMLHQVNDMFINKNKTAKIKKKVTLHCTTLTFWRCIAEYYHSIIFTATPLKLQTPITLVFLRLEEPKIKACSENFSVCPLSGWFSVVFLALFSVQSVHL